MTNQAFEPNVNAFLNEARDAVEKDEWERAKECALKVKAFDPDNKYAKSILEAAKLLPAAADPAPVERLLQQAIGYLDNENWERAVDRAVAVRALDPYNVDAARIADASTKRRSLIDPQTGIKFLLQFESRFATVIANLSFAYLLGALLFIIWMAVDTLFHKNTFFYSVLGFKQPEPLFDSDGYRLLALTAIAGAFGGTLDSIRSLVRWHAEADAYSPRFFWRDVAMPWVGGTVGVLTYVLVRSGAGLINGDFKLDEGGVLPVTAASALGFVGGFSSVQVYKWIDATGDRIFSTTKAQVEKGTEKAEATQTG